MKRKLFFIVILFFVFAQVWASGIVPQETAKRVAINFYYEAIQSFQNTKLADIKITDTYVINENNMPVYYVFNINNQGHIYVAAYDNIHPVLGYSYEGIFKNESEQSPAYNDFMQNFKEQIIYAQTNKIEATVKVNEEWTKYSKIDFVPSKSITTVGPLLTTTWNQNCYYNELCPTGTYCNGHVPTGCAATAMAQVMKYHNYPTNGIGTHTYTDPASCGEPSCGIQTADFGNTTYGWSNMPNALSGYNNSVAILMKHCGVSLNTNYGSCGSSASTFAIPEALIYHFNYYFSSRSVAKYSNITDWQNLLVQEINSNRPLIYYGWNYDQSEGHGFVCDGYQNSTYFHFNWGWGGSCDGYFYLDNLTPNGNNFNYYQGAIVEITPPKMNGPDVVCNGTTNNFSVIPVAGATYVWTLPEGFTRTSPPTDGVTPPIPEIQPPSIYVLSPSTGSGVYTISVNVKVGAKTQTISKTYRLGPPPEPNDIEGPSIHCTYASHVYTTDYYPYVTYTWTSNSPYLRITQNSNTNHVTVWSKKVGNYILSVKTTDICGTSAIYERDVYIEECNIDNTAVTGDKINNTYFTIFPNPASNNFTINLSAANEANYSVKLVNVLGKQVYINDTKFNQGENSMNIDTKNLSNGMYNVIISNGTEIKIGKVIISH